MNSALTERLLRETYIEIDLDRVAHNVRAIKRMCGPAVKLGAVVKADAYGHGALQLADTLVDSGADLLCVATLSEAVELKRQNPAYPVLIMGLTPASCFDWLLRCDIIQTIDSLEQAQALNACAANFDPSANAFSSVNNRLAEADCALNAAASNLTIPASMMNTTGSNSAVPASVMNTTGFNSAVPASVMNTTGSNSAVPASARKARVHIKLDTGFHRLGFADTEQSLDEIAAICRMPNLSVEGIFTHLVLLDDASNEAQFNAFLRCREGLAARGVHIPCWHIADSIAGVDYPQYRMDMIRTGALLYGLKGFHKGSLDVRQALSFKTRINHISAVKAGEGVSYDFTWRAEKDTRIGTLPFGYADGYPRSLNHKGLVTVRGKRVPIVGIICMDQCMIDLSEVPEARLGDEVVIYGDGADNTLSIQEISQLAGTNKNDIVARLTRRPPRVYTSGGKIVAVRTMLD